MGSLLGNDASSDDCPIQARTVRRLDSARETIDLTRVPAGYGAPAVASNT